MASLTDGALYANGKIRDVSAHILQLTASKQPYTAMVKKGRRVFNQTPEWPFIKEPSAVTSPTADGLAVSDSEFVDYESLHGMLQGRATMVRISYGIGEMTEAMTKQYGNINSKRAQYALLATKALARSIEAINLGSQDSYTQTVSSRPQTMTRGLYRWLGGTDTPVDLSIPSDARAPSGNRVSTRTTAGAVLESDIRGVMQSIAETTKNSSSNFVCFCSPSMKAAFSNYSYSQDNSSNAVMPLRRFNAQASDKQIMLDVTSYSGDFGTIKLHPHFDLPNGSGDYTDVYNATSDNGYGRTAGAQKMDAGLAAALTVHGYLVDMDMVELNMVKAPTHTQLTNDGSGPRGYVNAIWVHCVLNPQAHGVIYYVKD